MRLVKMSLLAATLIATSASAFTLDNVKFEGDAKLFYGTNDAFDAATFGTDPDAELFSTSNSWGQTSLGIGATAELSEGVTARTHLTAISTMGLTNIVSGVFEGGLTDEFWFDEMWLSGTYGKTTAKVGRMTIDTPLAFTETWSVAYNTFEAGVLINQDIPDTTLVGAYLGAGNNGNAMGQWGTGQYAGITADWDGNQNSNFTSINAGKGAYAVGVVNNSWTPLTVQGWYYNLPSTATAYWVQGDYASDFGLSAGLQLTGIDINAQPTGDTANMAYAGKVGYEMKDTFAVSLAGSKVGENDNDFGAGYNVFGAQTKLYTEAWWNFTYVTRPDTVTVNVTATTPEELTYVALGVYATKATVGENGTGVDQKQDMSEVTLEVAKSFGSLDAGLYYIYTDAQDQNNGDSYGSFQAYFTYNF